MGKSERSQRSQMGWSSENRPAPPGRMVLDGLADAKHASGRALAEFFIVMAITKCLILVHMVSGFTVAPRALSQAGSNSDWMCPFAG
jgi:hypothetical protein